ncbi:TetR/AcrR family transcriptional regulator [Porphyromonas sp.]|uniref:TetR/AcrR family transcriptional regulator n=1 Tax=Porphyromonas sp. TaxID=1924944 RepID=UPI0026DD4E9E|nr:TetR family transcriptional regulator [Porphyromonas sp.]MDO4771444.1 TetR family transcriptional regulator [Porphyromonas sp.]
MEAISKTRTAFLNAARKLFAREGFDKTTMNDIAVESQRGRRTLYTYFKNKNEVFTAVIEQELESLSVELASIVESPLKATKKLLMYGQRRLALISEVVKRNGSLNAAFFQDISLVERARLRFDIQETRSIQKILREGIAASEFEVTDTRFMAILLHNSLKGLEVPYIKGQLSRKIIGAVDINKVIKQFIFEGIAKRNND